MIVSKTASSGAVELIIPVDRPIARPHPLQEVRVLARQPVELLLVGRLMPGAVALASGRSLRKLRSDRQPERSPLVRATHTTDGATVREGWCSCALEGPSVLKNPRASQFRPVSRLPPFSNCLDYA